MSSEELITMLCKVTRDIWKESEGNLPIIKYKSHFKLSYMGLPINLKHYWTTELTMISKENKRLMKEWKSAGSRRNDDSALCRQYQNAKHPKRYKHLKNFYN